MLSKLTLIGIHNYSKGAIWDDIDLPEGYDKEILVNEILKQCGEFCLIYPDQDFLKVQIEQFFKKWYHNFDRWMKANNFDYEALYNLDVKSTVTEEGENYAQTESREKKSDDRGAGSGTSPCSQTSPCTTGNFFWSGYCSPVGTDRGDRC